MPSYKSYCWSLGTTSFRMVEFNKKIEEQLRLLNQFWHTPEYTDEKWSSNSAIQVAYYNFIREQKILHILINDLKSKAKIDLIIWSQLDGLLYKRLMYIFDLCWENLTTETERSSFESKGWIVNKIVSSCYKVSTNSLIARELAYRAERLAQNKNIPFLSVEEMFIKCPIEMQEHTDEIIKSIFSLQKNWLQYRAPKWINVVDSLQKYATKQLGLPSGDYSYVAEMIENSFIPSNFRILLEYGIPQTTINKIQSLLLIKKVDTKNITEDDLLSILADNKDYFRKNLTEYEIEILTNAL